MASTAWNQPSTTKLKFSNSQNIKVLSKYLPDNLGELRLSAFYVAVGRDCFVLRYNFLICSQCSLQKNSLIVGNLRHFVLSFNISNRQLAIIYATYRGAQILNREFKITTTATATGTSLNKRFNEQNNSCARAL